MFFLVRMLFAVLDDALKLIIAVVALVFVAQLVGIDVVQIAQQQIQSAISPF